jgi:hypothetical protein
MTDYTATQLAIRVLKDLGLLGVDETPSAEELEFAEITVAAEIGLMEASGIPIWGGGTASVPEYYLTLLSRRIGLALAVSYGLGSPGEIPAAMVLAERELRRLGTKPATGQTQTAEYF